MDNVEVFGLNIVGPLCSSVLPPIMSVLSVVSLRYTYPGQPVARLRCYMLDSPVDCQTQSGLEMSLGPCEYFTDHRGWWSASDLHGGWNQLSTEKAWIACSDKGSNAIPLKIIFCRGNGMIWYGEHPRQIGVTVTAELQSITRWRTGVPREVPVGVWQMATRSHLGGGGYINARAGEEYNILYVGLHGKDAGWLYVESSQAERGWISQECFTRWRMRDPRTCDVGVWQVATSSHPGGSGYINAREGEEYHILYVGIYGEEEGWLYVRSKDGAEGWILQEYVEIEG